MTDKKIIEVLRLCHNHAAVIVQYCYESGKMCDITLADVIGVIERQQEMADFWKAQYSFSLDDRSVTALLAKENYEIIRTEQIKMLHDEIDRLIKARDEARRDCAVAERNHANAVQDLKNALLKKIFPYDTADKKQYSINAYAVERAIIEVAEELYDTKRNN